MAVIYRQSEVDKLLTLPKYIDGEMWNEKATPRGRKDEEQVAIPCVLDDESQFADAKLKVIIRVDHRKETMAFVLNVRLGKRPEQPICRYEVQNSEHINPPWYSPEVIEVGEFHRHVFNARAYEEYYMGWDKCADSLGMPSKNSSPQSEYQSLKKKFLTDLNIDIRDKDASRGIWAMGPQR